MKLKRRNIITPKRRNLQCLNIAPKIYKPVVGKSLQLPESKTINTSITKILSSNPN